MNREDWIGLLICLMLTVTALVWAMHAPRIQDSPLPGSPEAAECKCGPGCACCDDDDFKRRRAK